MKTMTNLNLHRQPLNVRRLCRSLAPAALAAGLMIFSGSPSRADSVSDFYKGKTVTLLVSSAAGGGYDALARLISRIMPKHIPGNPTVIVKNMPGAGGIVATNYGYRIAPKDGTTIIAPQNNVPFEPLYGTKEAKYDAQKITWIGSPAPETAVLTIWHTSPVNTIADTHKHQLRMGSSGENSTPSFYGKVFMETLGANMQIIVGYPGQNDALLAMERGEIDGYPSAFYNSLMATRPTWIPEKKVKMLVQIGAEKEKAIDYVPFARDLAKNDADRELIDQAAAPLAVGRPYGLPPGVPADRVAALRKAFMDTMHDPQFQEEQAKIKLGADNPKTGEEIQQIIAKSYQRSESVINRIKGMLGQKKK
jgi:tripartite-type tricarboxylate transporter receptor subunit TctC